MNSIELPVDFRSSPAMRAWKRCILLAATGAILIAVFVSGNLEWDFRTVADALATVFYWAAFGTLLLLPSFALGLRRWLSISCSALLVLACSLLLALRIDGLRALVLVFLWPLSVLLLSRALSGQDHTFLDRCVRSLIFFSAFVVAAPFLYASTAVLQSYVGAAACAMVGLSVLWLPLLAAEQHSLDSLIELARLEPAHRARSEATRNWSWVLLLLLTIPPGIMLARIWDSIPAAREFLAALLFVLPVIIRGGQVSSIVLSIALASSVVIPIALCSQPRDTLHDLILTAYALPFGLVLGALVAGRVEWWQRLSRLLAFGCSTLLCGSIYFVVEAFDPRTQLSRNLVLIIGPAVQWCPTFLTDRLVLSSREADQLVAARAGREWAGKLGYRLPKWVIQTAAAALFLAALCLPFALVTSGLMRHRLPKAFTSPELRFTKLCGRPVAVSRRLEQAEVPWCLRERSDSILRMGREYANMLSYLEGLSPCHGRIATEPAHCTGYRALSTSEFKDAQNGQCQSDSGSTPRSDFGFRLVRDVTRLESQRAWRHFEEGLVRIRDD